MTYPKSLSWPMVELALGLAPKCPLFPCTQSCPCPDAEGQGAGRADGPPPASLWRCLLSAVSQAWVGTFGHEIGQDWKDPAQLLPGPAGEVSVATSEAEVPGKLGPSLLTGHTAAPGAQLAHLFRVKDLEVRLQYPQEGGSTPVPCSLSGHCSTGDSPVASEGPYSLSDRPGHANQEPC